MSLKKLSLAIIILILCVALGSAQSEITLKLPADNVVSKNYEQEFIYAFDSKPDLINCSLIIDNEIAETRNTLFQTTYNKMNVELEQGSYEWMIKCVKKDYSELVSETRTLSIASETITTEEGYEIEYYSSGLRSYVVPLTQGAEPVELPEIKGGEDIQLVYKSRSYYLDIIKMGAHVNTSFVEVRDRAAQKIHRMRVLESIEFDLDQDEIIDASLLLQEVERGINAYFTITPFPGAAAQEDAEENISEEETIEDKEEVNETEPLPEEETQEETTQEAPAGEQEVEEELPEEETQTEETVSQAKDKTGLWSLILLIFLIIIIVLIVVFLVIRHLKKPEKNKEPKQKKDEKAESKKTPGKPEESKPDKKPEPKSRQDFDIIKSARRKRK